MRNKIICYVAAMILISFSSASVHGQTFQKAGFYIISHDGWIRNSIPDGDVYTCAKCKDQIQVQISFGDVIPRPFFQADFIKMFDTERKRKDFADSMIRNEIPGKNYTIDVYRTGMTEIGGIKVAQFGSVVDMGNTLTHDVSMVGIHRNRFVKITLNHFDGAMNKEVEDAIGRLYSSLKFE